jgi:DNA-binding NtrC family response regulator
MHMSVGRVHTPRVLIADSDPNLRQLVYSALLAADIFSDCVSTVPDALGKLRDEVYGVVLVDVALPGGNPEQILAQIAEIERAERPVVLVLAANPAHARTLDVEIVQIVLRKPVALRQTVDLVRSCIQSTTLRVPGAGDSDSNGDGDGDHVTS